MEKVTKKSLFFTLKIYQSLIDNGSRPTLEHF